MGYYLTVISGPDEGRTWALEEASVMIGRSPSAGFVLQCESVAWEHALVEVKDGGVTISNLAAGGTRVRGKRISAPTRLSPQDEIELSPECRLLMAEEQTAAKPPVALIAVVALLLVGLIGFGGVYAYSTLTDEGQRPISVLHWRRGYARLDQRLDMWATRDEVPGRALQLFRNAWRLEQVKAYNGATRNWEELNSILLTHISPVTGDDKTMSESASGNAKALNVIMGYDRRTPSTDYEWNTDNAYADALVWFVRKRAAITRKLAADAADAGKKKKGKKK